MPGRLKELMLKEYEQRFENIGNVFLIRYSGLDMHETNELRRRIFDSGNTMFHVRNLILTRALDTVGLAEFARYVAGPSAVVYGDDVIAGIKVVSEFAKENGNVEVHGGYFDGEVLTPEEVKELAGLPPREVLLAQLMGAMRGPVTGVASALQGLLQKLVLTIKELESKL